jgi:predicted dehydrogenase
MEAAMAAGLHAIAEKPWLCSSAETESLAASAAQRSIRLGIHFEYCLLDEMEAWRERYLYTAGLRFGGRFAISRPGRHGIPAIVNLGSHLVAMRRYAVPQSEITELACAYDAPDERLVWIQHESVDFLENRQPIIQRFLRRFEAAIQGAELPFGIEFGLRVAEDLLRWLGPQNMESLQP